MVTGSSKVWVGIDNRPNRLLTDTDINTSGEIIVRSKLTILEDTETEIYTASTNSIDLIKRHPGIYTNKMYRTSIHNIAKVYNVLLFKYTGTGRLSASYYGTFSGSESYHVRPGISTLSYVNNTSTHQPGDRVYLAPENDDSAHEFNFTRYEICVLHSQNLNPSKHTSYSDIRYSRSYWDWYEEYSDSIGNNVDGTYIKTIDDYLQVYLCYDGKAGNKSRYKLHANTEFTVEVTGFGGVAAFQ